MTEDGLHQFANGLAEANGLDYQVALNYAVLIGDTPAIDIAGRAVVRGEDGHEIVRVELPSGDWSHFVAVHVHSRPIAADNNEIMRQLIDNKNDREAAILAGAFLESHLSERLRAVIVDSIFQPAKQQFDCPRPLSSFAGMLSMSYAFGIISHGEFLHLRTIKNVRNLAAHPLTSGAEPFSFSSEPARKVLRDFYPKEIRNRVPAASRVEAEKSFEFYWISTRRLAFRMNLLYSGPKLGWKKRSHASLIIAPGNKIPTATTSRPLGVTRTRHSTGSSPTASERIAARSKVNRK